MEHYVQVDYLRQSCGASKALCDTMKWVLKPMSSTVKKDTPHTQMLVSEHTQAVDLSWLVLQFMKLVGEITRIGLLHLL